MSDYFVLILTLSISRACEKVMKSLGKGGEILAASYDNSLANGSAPVSFEGYDEVLDEVVDQAQATPGMSVLDLGTGTGNLADRFINEGCEVWGLDFSEKMLAKAQEKLPSLHIVHADMNAEAWPQILNQRFDRIVSAYVWHDFDLAHKMGLLKRLAERHLVRSGRLVVADVAYPDQAGRSQAQAYWGSLWSKTEHYWAADETIAACKTIGMSCTYRQVSSCAGVFVTERACAN